MTHEVRFAIRSIVAVVLAVVLFPILVGAGFLVGAKLGCTADTIGGGAGRENDPCRDAGLAMLAGGAGGLVVWFGVGLLALRWADAAAGDDQAAEVSPAASPKASG